MYVYRDKGVQFSTMCTRMTAGRMRLQRGGGSHVRIPYLLLQALVLLPPQLPTHSLAHLPNRGPVWEPTPPSPHFGGNPPHLLLLLFFHSSLTWQMHRLHAATWRHSTDCMHSPQALKLLEPN